MARSITTEQLNELWNYCKEQFTVVYPEPPKEVTEMIPNHPNPTEIDLGATVSQEEAIKRYRLNSGLCLKCGCPLSGNYFKGHCGECRRSRR
jgi:hypothetical protein